MPNPAPQIGDHVRTRRAGFWHHAICTGVDNIVHYTGVNPNKANAKIQIGTLDEFTQGQPFEVVLYGVSDPIHIVLERAFSRVGENAYDLIQNNCEQFATWCKTGIPISEQVQRGSAAAGGAVAHVTATSAAIGVVSAVGAVAGTSGPGVMSGLATIGKAAGLGAAGGIGVVAAIPAAVTSVAVNYAFRDNANLHEDERTARRSARATGNIATVAGTLSTVGLVSAIGVPGLSAVGMTTGLAGLGSVFGGGMVAGLVVAATLPVAACAGLATLAYFISRRRTRT